MSEQDLGQGLEALEEGIEDLKNKEFKIFGIKVTAVTAGAASGRHLKQHTWHERGDSGASGR